MLILCCGFLLLIYFSTYSTIGLIVTLLNICLKIKDSNYLNKWGETYPSLVES